MSPPDEFDDGRPDAQSLDATAAKNLPLHAFALLESGDVFEMAGGQPPKEGAERAKAYLERQVHFEAHGATEAVVSAVKAEIIQQLRGNLQLINRLLAAKPLSIELIPLGQPMAAFGYPKRISAKAAGLFWDHASWPRARIALLQKSLATERALVTHEMAHAIQRLAFTEDEQKAIYRLMLPTYRSRAWVDEVFAIYTEREFVPFFTEREGHAPGVYGLARQRWDERHVFTRFVRHLYHPHRPLAGSRL